MIKTHKSKKQKVQRNPYEKVLKSDTDYLFQFHMYQQQNNKCELRLQEGVIFQQTKKFQNFLIY